MTGIPLFDAFYDLINFLRTVALLGLVGLGILLVIGATGSLQPYTSWGLFVERYMTGGHLPWGYSLMSRLLIGFIVCLVVWFALGQLIPQTPQIGPRFP